MLDYDAMRSKVKKLTEKPDKDASKLPRAEKETEMVSLQGFLDENPLPPPRESTPTPKTSSEIDMDLMEALAMPSPPKALQRPEIERLRRSENSDRTCHDDLSRNVSLSHFNTPRLSRESAQGESQHFAYNCTTNSSFDSSHSLSSNSVGGGASSADNLLAHTQGPAVSSRSFTQPANPPPLPVSPGFTLPRATSTTTFQQRADPKPTRPYSPSPFFQPSELEDIMRPFKEEFVQRHANRLVQAKAAYEQLNEQLSTELPQLIDLRYALPSPGCEQ